MRHRTAINCACVTSATSSFIGAFVIPLLRSLGINWLGGKMGLFDLKNVEINWDAIWLIVFIASVVALIGFNFDLLKKWRRDQAAKKYRDWNMSFCEAIQYMASSSRFRIGVAENRATLYAAAALVETAASGKIRASGRLPNSLLLSEIPNYVWRDNDVNIDGCQYGEHQGAKLMSKADSKATIYSGIMLDKKEVRTLWPPISSAWSA
jgi:hypothetical protein